jgi:hypothetical protein
MRMDLLNQTLEAEPTKSRAKPRQEITSEVRISPEGRDKTNQGEEAKKDMEKAQEVREQTPNEPTTDLTTRRNKEVAQLRWKEKSEMTTPPCKTQRER